MSQLQDQFIQDFAEQGQVTTKEIYEWYCNIKHNPYQPPYRNQIHPLIINPLLHKGILVKIDFGTYRISPKLVPPKEEDDE